MSTRKAHAEKSVALARERYAAALGTVLPDLPLQEWLSAVQATLAAAKEYRETVRKHLGETAEFDETVSRIQGDTALFLGRLQDVQRAIAALTNEEERAKASEAEKRSALEVGAALTETSNPALSQKIRAALEAGQSLDEFAADLGKDLK
ncbi:MAG: hypothetical protein ACT4P4_24345 [Betaproteobacteria bacterium]